jgi:DMSO reductase anchor subunit
MYPAFSLIAFTTLSGLGFGAMAWIGLGLGQSDGLFGWLAAPLAMLFAVAGLLASTRHLRRPDRAKYALSQWRSSWLSREGVLAIAALAVFGLHAALWLLLGWRSGMLGLLAAVLSGATVYATGMIYAQLKTVPRWNIRLTPFCFMAFALASGALLVAALVALTGDDEGRAIGAAIFLLLVAWATKWVWWQKAEKATLDSAGASIEAATGLGRIGTVRQFEAPHTGPNYLMKEMVFEVGRRRAGALRKLALGLGAAAPLLLILLSSQLGPLVLILALAAMMAGLMAERWLFFAEAQHAVAAYYGRR